MQIALFEGVSGVGKTSLLSHIKKKINLHNNSKFTQLFYSEHMTERIFEPAFHGGLLRSDQVKYHLISIIAHLEGMSIAYAQSPFSDSSKPVCQAFIERFGISHCLKQYLTEEDLNTVFQKFPRLHNTVTLFHLQLTKEKISHNIQTSLVYRNQEWANYVQSQGGVELIADELWSEQRQATSLIEKIRPYVCVVSLDVSTLNYESLAEVVLEKMSKNCSRENSMASSE